MNNNIEFLNYIYQNSSMGITSIDDLIDNIKDENFRQIIIDQQDGYRVINEDAISLLNEFEVEEISLSSLTKITTYLAIKMNLLKDSSISHIAEMMIQGSNMGVIDITKKVNSFKDCNKKVIKLAKQLLDLEENYIEELQPFLKEKENRDATTCQVLTK